MNHVQQFNVYISPDDVTICARTRKTHLRIVSKSIRERQLYNLRNYSQNSHAVSPSSAANKFNRLPKLQAVKSHNYADVLLFLCQISNENNFVHEKSTLNIRSNFKSNFDDALIKSYVS